MKKTRLITASMLLLFGLIVPQVKAQEVSTGLDIYSSYLWRGSKFGTGAALQPSVEFSAGGFALGAWGSYSTGSEGFEEADLYAGYGFDLSDNASLSFTLTDYYYPGTSWTEAESHYLEPMVSLGVGAFSFTAAYVEGLGDSEINTTGDLYLEAAVTAGPVDIALGGGSGDGYWYSDNGDFKICNIMVGTSKEVQITESFSLPVSGAVMLNPSTGGFHIAVGISL